MQKKMSTLSHICSMVKWGVVSTLTGITQKQLFYTKGSVTIIVMICVMFILPSFPYNTRWLTPEMMAMGEWMGLGNGQPCKDYGMWLCPTGRYDMMVTLLLITPPSACMGAFTLSRYSNHTLKHCMFILVLNALAALGFTISICMMNRVAHYVSIRFISASQHLGYAFLLGVHPEPPNVDKEEASSMCAVQHFYGGTNQELFTAQWDNGQLEKIEFRVPLHTTNRDKWTTYVGQFYSESDCHLDMFDAIKATMDVPKKFQHLGWCLSTACHMDPPHWFLMSLDIDSTFKAVRVEQSSSRNKKVVTIEVVNTVHFLVMSCKQSPSSLVSYPNKLEKVKRYDRMLMNYSSKLEIQTTPVEWGESHMTPQPFKRSFALYMDSDEESDNEEPLQHIKDILNNDRGILYLPTTAHFGIRFYKEKVGMPEGAAYTFQSCVSETHMKAELVKQRRRAKGKKKAQAQSDGEDEENICPSF
ncbi:uncharacterized protein BJ212DRAFT_1304857 [Suillus subaureus]|uniref:Uncharacterized protein n=1 Tax=Suillus subaureus TaxID=48587 RepID=A0A9P7DT82_9AGAM|nr:uncharacterized protein BJ212DRAFT_1304857 [Suillus subaureus]KAG1802385.1 hypothetical protein BJ212DRAFT_1304857 [Suillus subaureus]